MQDQYESASGINAIRDQEARKTQDRNENELKEVQDKHDKEIRRPSGHRRCYLPYL